MEIVRKYLDKVLEKDTSEKVNSKKRDDKTAKYAREVTEKYKKTLRKLAHE